MWQGWNNYKIRSTITNKQQKSYGSKGEGTITGEDAPLKSENYGMWIISQ